MSDKTPIAAREMLDRENERPPLSRRFGFTAGRARSLWRVTMGYLDGALERRRSTNARAAERALLQLDDRTLRDIGVKRCDVIAMACGLSREDLVLEEGDHQRPFSREDPVETTVLPVFRCPLPAVDDNSFWRSRPRLLTDIIRINLVSWRQTMTVKQITWPNPACSSGFDSLERTAGTRERTMTCKSRLAALGIAMALSSAALTAPTHSYAAIPPSGGSPRVTCNVGSGNTAAWARCTGSGQASLGYWCKENPFQDAWQSHFTKWVNVYPGRTTTISRECVLKVKNATYKTR